MIRNKMIPLVRILGALMVGALAFGLPQLAQAATYEICVKVKVRHTDSGLTHGTGATEDQWIDTNSTAGVDVKARGFLVHLRHIQTGWSQFIYTHYSTGCLTFNNPGSSSGYTVTVFGQARDSAGNIVRIHDAGTSTSSWAPGTTALEEYTNQSLSSSSTNYYVLDGVMDDTWTTIATAAFGLYRYHNGNSNKWISIGFDNGACGNSGSILGNSENYIESDDAHLFRIGRCSGSETESRRKFTITHELGHAMARLYYGYDGDDGPRNSTYDPVVTPSNSGDCKKVSGYGMLSLEFGSQAFKEGFADFYSAKVWNNKATNGAYSRSSETYSLYHWNPNGSGPDTAGGVVNNYCGWNVLSITTRNDFLRYFWQFYTTPNCSVQPGMTDMMRLYRGVRENHRTGTVPLHAGTQNSSGTITTYSNYAIATKYAIQNSISGLDSCLKGNTLLNNLRDWNQIDGQ